MQYPILRLRPLRIHVLYIIMAAVCLHSPFHAMARKTVAAELKQQYFLDRINDEKTAPIFRLPYIDSLDMLAAEPADKYLMVKGKLYVKAARFNEAIACLENLSSRNTTPLKDKLQAQYWLAWCYNATGRYKKTLDTALSILGTAKPDSLSHYDAWAYIFVSKTYDLLRDYQRCRTYLDKAAKKLTTLEMPDDIRKQLQTSISLNRSALYLNEGKYSEALELCKKLQTLDIRPEDAKLLDMNFAHLFWFLGEPDMAEKFYRKFLHDTDNSEVYSLNHESAMFNYALLLLNQKRYRESEKLCRRQIPNTYITGQQNTRALLYEVLGDALNGQGCHKEAFEALSVSLHIRDSLRNTPNGDMPEITSVFEARLAELEQSKAQSGRHMAFWWLMALPMAGIAGIAVYAGSITRRKNKRKKLWHRRLWNLVNDEQIQHCRDKDIATREIDDANRRIVSLSMQKAETESILAQIRKTVTDSSASSKEKITDIQNMLKIMPASDRNWEVFRTHFEKVHPDFISNLCARHPDLTPGDIRMAAFMVMNMSAKEIAALLCRSQRTVESARYRLHKKLQLAPGIQTAQYLRSFMR